MGMGRGETPIQNPTLQEQMIKSAIASSQEVESALVAATANLVSVLPFQLAALSRCYLMNLFSH